MSAEAQEATSTRPYLIRALYEWCTDNGFTPYIAVQVDETVQVPREYVKDGEIVLNISFDATSSLKLGNQFIEFSARFAGTAREIMVPVERVIAIYARENGQGMAFPQVPAASTKGSEAPAARGAGSSSADAGARGTGDADVRLVPSPAGSGEGPDSPPPGSRPKPTLTRVK
ncbi:MAG: ClpXP protease specificity-enhancing factor [Thermomicrobiales bacterium]